MIFRDNTWQLFTFCPFCHGEIFYNWDYDQYYFRRKDPDCLCIVPICSRCGKLKNDGRLVDDGETDRWVCDQCLEMEKTYDSK